MESPFTFPPLPRHQRRLSIKSLASSIRRSINPVVVPGNVVVSTPTTKPRRRSSSVFPWSPKRQGSFTTENDDVYKADVDTLDDKIELVMATKFNGSSSRKLRSTPTIPTLSIELDSIAPLSRDVKLWPYPEDDDSSMTLPHFARSTFRPMSPVACDPVPNGRPLSVAKQLAARGPFPTRPASSQGQYNDNAERPHSKVLARSASQPDLSSRPSLPLEPRDPRVIRSRPPSMRRSSTSTPPPPPRASPSHRRARSNPPVLAPTFQFPRRSSSNARPSSMARSPSFTITLPTVVENVAPTQSPTRRLKPISIAPRTPPSPRSMPTSPTLSPELPTSVPTTPSLYHDDDDDEDDSSAISTPSRSNSASSSSDAKRLSAARWRELEIKLDEMCSEDLLAAFLDELQTDAARDIVA
ncbi:hypothetical protein JCM10212_001066 [Sporobolomyces blumeae]